MRLLGGYEPRVGIVYTKISHFLGISPHLISVRLNEHRKIKKMHGEIRRVAYLLDVHTISVGMLYL
jgi:hypothetical protein